MDATADDYLVEELRELAKCPGLAFFTSSDRKNFSLAKKDDDLTLFTGTLVKVLKEGIPNRPELPRLSWQHVKDAVTTATRKRLPRDAPTPKLLATDDKEGDITAGPYFVNRAFSVDRLIADPSAVARRSELEYVAWTSIRTRAELQEFDRFLSRFPDGQFAPKAVQKLSELINAEANIDNLQRFLVECDLSEVWTLAHQRLGALEWHAIFPAIKRRWSSPSDKKATLLREFIARFRTSPEATEARSYLAKILWPRMKKCLVPAELDDFAIEVYGTSEAAAAEARAASLRRRELGTKHSNSGLKLPRIVKQPIFIVPVALVLLFVAFYSWRQINEKLAIPATDSGTPVRQQTNSQSVCKSMFCRSEKHETDSNAIPVTDTGTPVAEQQPNPQASIRNPPAITILKVRPVRPGDPNTVPAADSGTPEVQQTNTEPSVKANPKINYTWCIADRNGTSNPDGGIPCHSVTQQNQRIPTPDYFPEVHSDNKVGQGTSTDNSNIEKQSGNSGTSPLSPSSSERLGWEIQVGALDTRDSALERLQSARASAGPLVENSWVDKVVKGGMVLFRARFGFSSRQDAEAACRKLKRDNFICLMIPPHDNQ